MKKNKILLVLLITLCVLTGCSKKKNNQKNEKPSLPEESIAFIDYVNGIVITLDAKEQIDEAFELYNNLSDDAWNYDEVLEAYDNLCDLENDLNSLLNDNKAADSFMDKVAKIPSNPTLMDEYLVIAARNAYETMTDKARKMLGVDLNLNILVGYEKNIETLKQAEANKVFEEEAIEFIKATSNLKDESQITLSDKETLDSCMVLYNQLSDGAKSLETVKKAYEKLSKCIEHYDYLINNPEQVEIINLENFIKMMEYVPRIVSLNDIISIKNAESAYRLLTEEQKKQSDIILLNEQLVTARYDYNVLYFEETLREECNAFLSLMQQIATPITKESGPAIKQTKLTYESLSDKAKQADEIVAAYQQLKAYLEEFNSLDIEILSADILEISASGTASTVNPTLTLKNIKTLVYSKLINQYGVSSTANLDGKCQLLLVFYKDNIALFESDITSILLENTDRVLKTTIVKLLQKASVTNQAVVSGVYSFGIRVVDLTGNFIDSPICQPTTNVTANYSFESLFDVTSTKEVIKIATLEDFLNIRNDLSGNYELANDIDASSITWENLGIFSGKLNGKGHTIKGLNCEIGPKNAFGIFLEIDSKGIVENLNVTGEVKNAGTYAGVIAVTNKGTIRNCFLNVTIASLGETTAEGYTGDACIGGVVADNQGSIENVISISKIEGKENTLNIKLDGGLCIKQNGVIKNSYVLIDNVSTKRVVGNDNTANTECAKTYSELLSRNIYQNFDNYIWEIVEGFLPELRVSED